ncbi:hypothetical protein AGMMS49928_01140 [Spirochaetia bacterium]|nr:hypothetical protein AGMMS49928_01140 [Spirochaetia bacterium]
MLASIMLGDSAVELLASGFWKANLGLNWGLALTPLGMTAVSNDSPLLFTQEADLTLSLWIRRRWFVEAAFQDDTDLNTYRAGYEGGDGDAVQYFGIGNKGLKFPRFPYLDLGGDSPSSFGVYGRFGGGGLKVHGMIRYDGAAREEKVFVGGRERSYGRVNLRQSLRGLSFVLPDENLALPPEVYLEDEDGPWQDSTGRRWRLAKAGEYAASARNGLVEFDKTPKGMAAVSYSGITNTGTPNLGTYGGSPATFLGDTAFWLGSAAALAALPQPGGGTGTPAVISINGNLALVIYEPGTFSPFERQSRYNSPSSSSTGAALIKASTGERISGYETLPLAEIPDNPSLALSFQPEVRRNVYELVSEAAANKLRDPEARWPLGDKYPELYLPGRFDSPLDMELRFTNYGSVSSYFLGDDVVEGSVEVFRGGLSDPDFTFDAHSGTVNLLHPSGAGETIRITYLKQGDAGRPGSLAAGVGVVYHEDEPFSAEAALGLRWNLAGESYSDADISNPGTVGLSSRLKWDHGDFKAEIRGGLGFEQTDTTGLYRAAGMEGNEITLSLPEGDSFISQTPSGYGANNRAPLVYRNYRDTSLLGTSTLKPIEWDAPELSGRSGPYNAQDDTLSSRILAAEFELDAARTWTGFQVPLNADGGLLEQSREIQIPFRFYDFDNPPAGAFSLIVQFGALADKDSPGGENPNLLVEKTLYSTTAFSGTVSNPAAFSESPRIASISFSAAERQKISKAKYMRIIVSYGGGNLSGRVLAAPPIIRGAGWRPVTAVGNTIEETGDDPSPPYESKVSVNETPDMGSQSLRSKYLDIIKRLHGDSSSNQRILVISWKNISPGESAGADGRIDGLPFSSYRSLSFFVRGPRTLSAVSPSASLRFVLARGPESSDKRNETALEAHIPLNNFTPGEWSKVTIPYAEGGDILVDGKPAGKDFTYNAGFYDGKEGREQSVYAAFLIEDASALPDGNFAVDEIILEDARPSYRANAGGSIEWKRKGVLVKYGGINVLEDFSVSAALETALRGDPFSSVDDSPGEGAPGGALGGAAFAGRSLAEFNLFGVNVKGNFSFSRSPEGDFNWEGGHGLSRTISFGPKAGLSLEEKFSVYPTDETFKHRAEIKVETVVRGKVSAEASFEEGKTRQLWEGKIGTGPFQTTPLSISLETSAGWWENSLPPVWLDNYGRSWAESWYTMLPETGESAERRAVKRDAWFTFFTGLGTVPLGAELSFKGSSAFSYVQNSTRPGTRMRLEIPFTAGALEMSFRIEREYYHHLIYSGESMTDDAYVWTESFKDFSPLMFSLPFYSLFDDEKGASLDELLRNSPHADEGEYGRFDDRYSFFLRGPGRYDIWAFFLPSSIEAKITRNLERNLDTPLDTLSPGGVLGFSSANMFGAFGVLPLFRFYQTDEFTQTLDASWKLPRGAEASFRIQDTQLMKFYGFTGAELDLTNTLTLNTDEKWSESLNISWVVPAPKSLVGLFYRWFTNTIRGNSWLTLAGLANAPYEQLRKESLEMVIDHTGEYPRLSFIAGHESIVRIKGRLDLSAFAKLSCSQDWQTEILSFIAIAGVSLYVRF